MRFASLLLVLAACGGSAAASRPAPQRSPLVIDAVPPPAEQDVAAGVSPPEGAVDVEVAEDEPGVHFAVEGALGETWTRWRAALAARGVTITIVEHGPTMIVAHLERAAARGFAVLAQSGSRLSGSLVWHPRSTRIALRSPCVVPPARYIEVDVYRREANPPPERAQGSETRRAFRTRLAFDVDSDGHLDAIVPIVEPNDCAHAVEYAIYVMRGACGHLVGRTLGFPYPIGRGQPGRLRDLAADRRWTEITDPQRPPGPHNVATLYEQTTRYVANGGTYQPLAPETRSGICHHCPLSRCRTLSAG